MGARYLVAEIPVGLDGLDGSQNQSQISPLALITANNLSFERGTLTKEGGSAKYNATSVATGGKIVGGVHWEPESGVPRTIIAVDNGHMMRATGAVSGTFADIATGLTLTNNNVVFVEGGKEGAAVDRKLFIYSANNSPRVLSGDGTSLATITDPPADWASDNPTFGVMHDNRVWAGGNPNDPHRLYYSTASDHENIKTGGGTFPVYPGEGQKLVAAASFKSFLIAWKFPKGIYIVDSTDPSVANWRVDKLNTSIGMASPNAWTVIDNDILFMDAVGNFQLISVISDESQGASNLSQIANMNEWVRTNVNLAQLHNVRAVYYAAKREAHFTMAGLGSSTNNLRIVIDFNRPDRIRFRHSDKDTCESLWLGVDANNVPRMRSGDDGGFVWRLDEENKDKGGDGYTGEFQTAHTDLSYLEPNLATIRKNFHWLEMVVEPAGNWDLNVTVVLDGAATETVAFNMGSAGAALGSFILDTDVLGGSYVLNQKRRIHGSGRRISLIGKNTAALQDFSVGKFYIHFTPGSNKLSL